jgi:hypothetical protein
MAQNNTNEHKTREVIGYGVQDLETGRIIGRMHMQDAKKFEKRLRKDKNTIISFALIVGLGLGAVSGVVGKGFIEDRQEAKQIAYVQQVEERKEVAAARESTYTIDYTIGYGQTISGIVYSYQSDPNIAENKRYIARFAEIYLYLYRESIFHDRPTFNLSTIKH